MLGKVCVITGATSGIGLVAAARLAAKGARLVLVGRDPKRGAAAVRYIRNASPASEIKVYYADLSLLSEMKRVADEIANSEPRIDVLINNAGSIFSTRRTTSEGLELTFALNHMSYFVVTNRLLNNLRVAVPSRIICTSSAAHKGERIDFTDLQSANSYNARRVYGRSKLANILFTRELARHLKDTGITANCFHPGFVATRFGSDNGFLARTAIRIAMLGAIQPEDGAKTAVYLASSPDIANTTAGYFYREKLTPPSGAAQDDSAARHLWEESARISEMVL